MASSSSTAALYECPAIAPCPSAITLILFSHVADAVGRVEQRHGLGDTALRRRHGCVLAPLKTRKLVTHCASHRGTSWHPSGGSSTPSPSCCVSTYTPDTRAKAGAVLLRGGHLRAVAPLLLGKLWVDGALDRSRLLHELRARARRGLLEPVISV